MLIKLSIDNFKSFSEPTELTMITSNKIHDTINHRVRIKSTNLLKNAVIYGANASGKSNFIEAFRFIKETLKYGLPTNCRQFFCKNEKENESKESSFELQFSVGDTFYAYGFSVVLSKRFITGEWLYELYQNGSAKRIYERIGGERMEIDETFRLSENDRQRMVTYIEDFGGTPHMLFLTELNRNKKYADTSKLRIFKQIYDWLSNHIIILSPDEPVTRFEYYYDNESLEKVNRMIETFDTGITRVNIEEISADELKNKLDSEIYEKVMTKVKESMNNSAQKHYRMTIRSNTSFFNIEGDSNTEPKITTIRLHHGKSFFDFDFEDESDGTRRLFDLLDMLLIDTDDVVFVVDELERSLHPKLTQRFLELFNEIHKERRMQLLFTTHEAAIMDQSLFRRDEIWFIERDGKNNSSVYSLERFKERYDKVLSKAYLEGRYGAIPVFKSFEFGQEE